MPNQGIEHGHPWWMVRYPTYPIRPWRHLMSALDRKIYFCYIWTQKTRTKNTIHVESYRKVNGHNFLTQKMASLKDSVRPSIVHEIGMIWNRLFKTMTKQIQFHSTCLLLDSIWYKSVDHQYIIQTCLCHHFNLKVYLTRSEDSRFSRNFGIVNEIDL